MTSRFYPKDVLITQYRVARERAISHNRKTSHPDIALLLAIYDFDSIAVQSLIQKGASLAFCDMDGCTALHLAAMTGQPDCVDLLLQNGADISTPDRSLNTALHLAADSHLKWKGGTIKMLLDAGADAHWRNDLGQTALHVAAASESPDELMLLIPQMRHLETEDLFGETALECAANLGKSEIVRLLLEAGAHPDRIPPASTDFPSGINLKESSRIAQMIASFQEKKILQSQALPPLTPEPSFHQTPKARL